MSCDSCPKDELNPLITVIVPSYNHRRYITECLNSIKNQTYHNFQWIVVDDGSKDGSQDFLKEKQEEYGYELYLQKNKGVSATLTDMIKNHAKGKYIACCASDDKWLPEKLQIQIDYMENHPECAMCFGRTYSMDENSRITGEDNEFVRYYRGGKVFDDIITQRFHPPVNYMIRRDVLAAIGFFPQGVIAEDFYMNCKISHDYELGYIPRFLGYYRIAPLQKKRDPLLMLKSHEETILHFKEESIFNKALLLHQVRVFCTLSYFTKYKFLSLKYLTSTIKIGDFKHLLRGVYNLFIHWYSC